MSPLSTALPPGPSPWRDSPRSVVVAASAAAGCGCGCEACSVGFGLRWCSARSTNAFPPPPSPPPPPPPPPPTRLAVCLMPPPAALCCPVLRCSRSRSRCCRAVALSSFSAEPPISLVSSAALCLSPPLSLTLSLPVTLPLLAPSCERVLPPAPPTASSPLPAPFPSPGPGWLTTAAPEPPLPEPPTSILPLSRAITPPPRARMPL
mmetsp:Transcript_16258/g.39962  ORF Transcript_16258/g.39962 Transcript_16258/m.39962 type:complete len:206 (+) Transcript_16258:506-1123(+)